MKRVCLLLIGLLIVGIVSRGQDVPDPNNFSKLTQVLNPTPEAASIGKYGGIPVNFSSGGLNLDVPIYTLSSYNLSIPISLLYNSSSIRVNEIAPSVGMSWALSAGGVITRTVYGMPDDRVERIAPPASFPAKDTAYVKWLYALGISDLGVNLVDGQPDLFSFNFAGQNGKFILDSSLTNAQLLTYSGIKIESRFTSSDSNYNFKITDVSGVQYFFGETAIERTSSRETSLDGDIKNLFASSITSYYLYKVIHPNSDTIFIDYTGATSSYIDNISETLFGSTSIGSSVSCGSLPHQSPTNTYGKVYNTCTADNRYVKKISSSSGASAVFNYVSRKDCDFLLLSSIYAYAPKSASPYKRFNFDYQYSYATNSFNQYQTDSSFRFRPFLKDIVESSLDSILTKKYHFSYNDIDALPARLSYSIDHYGYYNGKTTNTTLLPQPTLNTSWQQYMTSATANRSVDSVSALKGLLTGVVYPTGGRDSIVYEPNYYYGSVAVTRPDTTLVALASGKTRFGTAVYDTIVIQQTQIVHIVASCYYTQNPPDNPDEVHDLSSLTLYDVAAGQYLVQQTINVGDSYNSYGNLSLPPGTYILTLQASGLQVSAQSTTTYKPGPVTYVSQNIVTGGNRVKKVIAIDPVSNSQNIKRYFYGALNSLNQSSSSLPYYPNYERPAKFYDACSAILATDYTYNEWDYPCLYSNTQINACGYGNSPVSYSKVTESFGENFENGGIEHSFTQFVDVAGDALQGDFITNAPRTSYAYINGRELSAFTFRKNGEEYLPVKKILTNYRQDSRKNLAISSYVDKMKYLPHAEHIPPDNYELGAYDLTIFKHLQYWLYADTVRTFTYDQSGVDYSSDTVVVAYNNAVHALPTSTSTSTSDGPLKTVNSFYPQDIIVTGEAETARQALVSKHIWAPLLKSQFYKGGVPTYTEVTDYAIFGYGAILPKYLSLQIGSNAAEKRVEFYRYSNVGKPIEQARSGDVKHSFIWDYANLYPVAEVINADSSSIAFTSFESDGVGNWIIGSTLRDTTKAITGRRSYMLNSNISKTGLTSSRSYVVSYWTRSENSFSISGTIAGYPVKGKSVDGWTLFVHKVSGQTTISLVGNGLIDELRLYPTEAQMTTCTYTPMVGVTSQCDVGNRITYYEYDGLQRLKRVRDQNFNILKTYDYAYQASSGCGSGCYTLAMQTFAGTATLGYPVGVFDVHGVLLGNATGASAYVSLWNNDTADARIGTLSIGSDSLHFSLHLNTGMSLPAGVTGCRYYQVDMAWDKLDGVLNTAGAYVDFGDTTGVALNAEDTTLPANMPIRTTSKVLNMGDEFTGALHYSRYFLHTYLGQNNKTITVYHNDGRETFNFDNSTSDINGLTKLRNLRGNLPQQVYWYGGSCFQDTSMLTVSKIANWNTIHSVELWSPNSGDGGVHPTLGLNFAQDFMAANQNLKHIVTAHSYWYIDYYDSTFKISRLKSDWNTYFSQLQTLWICDAHWNHEDISGLKNLTSVVLFTDNVNHSNNYVGNSVIPLSPAVMDSVIIQVAAGAATRVKGGYIAFLSGGTTHTNSDAVKAAKAYLYSQGWGIYYDWVLEQP